MRKCSRLLALWPALYFISFCYCLPTLAYRHPVLNIEAGRNLPSKKLTIETLKKFNDDPGYTELEEVNYVQTSHCWLKIERQAAKQFAERLKGSETSTITSLVGEPFLKWKKLSYWKKNFDEPGEDWIYYLGFESVPVRLRILEDKCVQSAVLSDQEFAAYHEFMDSKFSASLGQSESNCIANFGAPSSIQEETVGRSFSYQLTRDNGPVLFFKCGKCVSVGFILHSGYKSRQPKLEEKPWDKWKKKEPPEPADWYKTKGK